MTREPEREEFEKWARDHPAIGVGIEGDRGRHIPAESVEALCREAFQAGERLGREDSDSVYWPALREQWRIEFGRELKQEGGHIMNIVDSVRELVREERERERSGRPRIVCLCGSTRFYEFFQRANYELTMAGKIVLSVGFYPHAQKEMHSEQCGCTPEQKIALDELHKRKIDLADEVYVLNVDGYIGESTRSEIEYAEKLGKPIRYAEAIRARGVAQEKGSNAINQRD